MIGYHVDLSSNMSKIGLLDPEIWAKNGNKVVKLRCLREKISRNMIVTKKLMMTNIIGNFIADNIVFRMEVLAHHPEELSLEIW